MSAISDSFGDSLLLLIPCFNFSTRYTQEVSRRRRNPVKVCSALFEKPLIVAISCLFIIALTGMSAPEGCVLGVARLFPIWDWLLVLNDLYGDQLFHGPLRCYQRLVCD